MLRSIFSLSRQNIYILVSSLYLLVLISLGKVSAMSILFVYFLETLIIGIFNALKMYYILRIGKKDDTSNPMGYGIILFFLVHYGFFVGIQSVFGFALFDMDGSSIFKEPFHILENYGIILSLEDVKYALPAIVLVYVGKFFTDFIRNKKYDVFNASEIMFKPYLRIVIQQFVVIISAFFIVFGKAGTIAAILLIILRFFIDLSLEAIKKDSKLLDVIAEKLANENESKEEIKKQLISFTE